MGQLSFTLQLTKPKHGPPVINFLEKHALALLDLWVVLISINTVSLVTIQSGNTKMLRSLHAKPHHKLWIFSHILLVVVPDNLDNGTVRSEHPDCLIQKITVH